MNPFKNAYLHNSEESIQKINSMNKCLGAVAKETGQAPQLFHSAVSAFWRNCTAILKMHHNSIHFMHTEKCHPFEWITICLHTEPEPVNWVSVLPPQRRTLSVSDQTLWEESCTLSHNMTSALSRASCQQLEDPSSWKRACKCFFVSSFNCRYREKNVPTMKSVWMLSPIPHLLGVTYHPLPPNTYTTPNQSSLTQFFSPLNHKMSLLETKAITGKTIQENDVNKT